MRRLVLIAASAALVLGLAAQPVAARQPGPTIVETALAVNGDSGEFDYLIQAVVKAGLVNTLNGNRQFTVFAPTDAAFEDLFDALGVDGIADIDVATLTAVLLYHVAPGERFSDDVVASSRIRTVSKGFVFPSVHDGGAYINDARIVAADIDVSNGVIHVIDAVLLP
ncbi:MAG: fasciclin domain-containing protein, partial [Chloroflexota bacterium]|nr:fasciclin domain-containing protein [Chloroflexota bacterium]